MIEPDRLRTTAPIGAGSRLRGRATHHDASARPETASAGTARLHDSVSSSVQHPCRPTVQHTLPNTPAETCLIINQDDLR